MEETNKPRTSYLAEFKRLKDDGMKGLSRGIPFSLERFNTVIPGIQKQRLYLHGAGSGVGKTKFINEHDVFNVLDHWLDSGKAYPLEIHYFALEMSRSQITVALILKWLFKKHGIIIDANYLLGYLVDKTLAPFYNELLESAELAKYVDAFQEVVSIMDTALNYVSFSNYMKDLAKRKGTESFNNVTTSEGKVLPIFDSYEENDSTQVTLIIIDHIGLVKTVTGQTERQMMIDMADIMIKGRNRYKFTFSVTQQLNRSSNSSDRMKMEDILPKDSDFRSGSGIFDAADIVLGLMSPNRERQSTFQGYRVQSTLASPGLGNRLTVVNVIKNRFGMTNVVVPLLFIGEMGYYEELPSSAEEFNYETLQNYKKHY